MNISVQNLFVHPALRIVHLSSKNDREKSVTEVGVEEGEEEMGGEGRGGDGESTCTQKNYSPGS